VVPRLPSRPLPLFAGYTKIDDDVPAQLRDVSIYGLPSGLTQIMR
jgi:hypothetical protein